MSSLRTTRARLVAAAATAVLAALSLTACEDGTGVHASDAPTPATATPNSPTTAPSSAAPSSGSSGAGSSSPQAGGTTGTARPAAGASASKARVPSGKPVTCEGANTRTVAAPLNRPVNHMLLTVTNTGSVPCYLYGYPAVRFGEAQAVPPVIEASQPQAVVALGPGESGYASVNLSATDGSGTNGHTVNSLTVSFHGRSGNESVGTSAHPSLPAKGVYVDDSLKVTYWQQSMDDAVQW
ncbi:DUF4232 domain-containing protein [Streptomyces sp. NBC_00557]|uniref:DUF4232 domain-containing protein n=1 Tax=Streptomyces sp. NBC_00557 TaxID=2975776 RepID=UPI002E801D18|nr:DUF4232 domain-containing protein [Streptomyces sp. NBC_00557]WUC35756.1 DUF4232 domain-containing protein [Streptomyces sp. NBC_00557]